MASYGGQEGNVGESLDVTYQHISQVFLLYRYLFVYLFIVSLLLLFVLSYPTNFNFTQTYS